MTTLERWLALAVGYWSCNMTVAYTTASYYPGFGYSDDEKIEMQSIAGKFSSGQYYLWTVITAVLFIVIVGAAMAGQMALLTYAIGGHKERDTAALFFLSFGVAALGCFSIGMPAAMLFSAALVGRWWKVADADLPDRAATARITHKLWFQITRIAIVMLVAVVAGALFIPRDSRFFVIIQVVLPLLSVVVSVVSIVYYLSVRVLRKTTGS